MSFIHERSEHDRGWILFFNLGTRTRPHDEWSPWNPLPPPPPPYKHNHLLMLLIVMDTSRSGNTGAGSRREENHRAHSIDRRRSRDDRADNASPKRSRGPDGAEMGVRD